MKKKIRKKDEANKNRYGILIVFIGVGMNRFNQNETFVIRNIYIYCIQNL